MEKLYEKIDKYYEVVSDFCDILREENQALIDFKTDKVGKLYDRKSKAVNAYRGIISVFIEHQTKLKDLDDQTKEDLKIVSQELDTLLKENDRLLKTRMEASQTVMTTIVNLAKMHQNSNATAYGAGGGYYNPDNSRNAIAINRTL